MRPKNITTSGRRNSEALNQEDEAFRESVMEALIAITDSSSMSLQAQQEQAF